MKNPLSQYYRSYKNKIEQDKKIKEVEKRNERQILKSMQQCEMKPLTKGQVADIRAYFRKHIGMDVPIYWHQYLYSRTGVYSVKYIPGSTYFAHIIWRLNNYRFGPAYADKGFYDTLFQDANRPATFIKNINGFYYDGKQPITKEEAISICSNLNGAVIKPTLYGHWGQGVELFHTENGFIPEMDISVPDLFNKYNMNFIVQDKLAQHPDLAKLNPTSVNTIRVLSYRNGDKAIILYAVIRIGRKGKSIDNETAGGIKADIDLATGRIKGPAFGSNKEKNMERTDSGVVLDQYLLPSFPQVLEFVKDLHAKLPYFKLVGWDVSVDANGNPVMIEWNKSAELSQVAHGPAFGEYTEEILAAAFKEKNSLLDNRL